MSQGENVPSCDSSSPHGRTFNITDGTYDRCFSAIVPPSSKPLHVLFWFHGAGGNAKDCGAQMRDVENGMTLGEYAEKYNFALICGEALQNIFGKGGQWTIPEIQTKSTGTKCELGDSPDAAYMRAVVAELEAHEKLFNMSKLFTSGCSMGSAFSEYSGNCMNAWYGSNRVPAFATHSSTFYFRLVLISFSHTFFFSQYQLDSRSKATATFSRPTFTTRVPLLENAPSANTFLSYRVIFQEA